MAATMHIMKRWHAWLELARISNLPTVWTNVLAGWLLAGGAWHWQPLAWLLAGGSLLYTAGMILNDAMDVKFDREHRQDRPIPSGRVSPSTAWAVGIAMLLIGAAMCFFGAGACGWVVLALVVVILVYDAYHKGWTGSVLVMGACRMLLYLVAGSAVTGGMSLQKNGILVLKAIVLGGYVVGLSLVARGESAHNERRNASGWLAWTALLSPVVAGVLVLWLTLSAAYSSGAPHSAMGPVRVGNMLLGNPSDYHAPGLQLAVLVLLCCLILYSVKRMHTPPASNIGRAVGLLLAGIVVVDGLAISFLHPVTSTVFAASMPLLLLWQRRIAAT